MYTGSGRVHFYHLYLLLQFQVLPTVIHLNVSVTSHLTTNAAIVGFLWLTQVIVSAAGRGKHGYQKRFLS